MPRRSSSPSSSDSEDAPEAFTLTQSKKAAQGQQDDIQRFQLAEKSKRKERNRDRDRKLKERSETRRTKDASINVEASQALLEGRMKRAMDDAAGESGSEDEEVSEGSDDGENSSDQELSDGVSGSDSSSEEEEEEDMASDQHDPEDEMASAEELEAQSDEEHEPSTSTAHKSNPNYLPDHLFTSVFSAQPKLSTSHRKASLSLSKQKTQQSNKKRKRKSSRMKTKDTIIGSRALRILPKASHQVASVASNTLPTAKVNKFINRSLNVKGSNQKAKGWERRPVNIGVMKSSGPPSSFIRRAQ